MLYVKVLRHVVNVLVQIRDGLVQTAKYVGAARNAKMCLAAALHMRWSSVP
jgi:hypothetical protein